MDRATYLKIRNSFDLSLYRYALLSHFFKDAVLVSATAGVWTHFQGSMLRFLSIPLFSTFMFRCFGIMHEAVHGAVSKNKIINDSVGILAGAVGLFPYETWRKSHLSHHYWSGNVEKDSVMAFIIVFPKLSVRVQTLISRIWKMWLPILGVLQHVVFWKISLKIYFENKRSLKVLVSLLAPVLVWGAILSYVPVGFSLGILGPALFLYFVGIEVVNLPHHLQLPQFRGEEKFPAWQQYQTVRTCLYPKWFSRFVILNFNFHTEHHMFPDVAWYHLDKLHIAVRDSLKSEYNTDPYFRWILENKRKNVKDVLSPVDSSKPLESLPAA